MVIDEKGLKPCPCCGSEVLLLPERQQWGNFLITGWVICCTGCSCGASNTCDKAVVEDWNHRYLA